MATWSTSNIVLTLKGREVLSKVQAGEGTLTVTRVVTGGGNVSPAQLFLQTAVKNEKQQAVIMKVDTDSEGSSIEVHVTNAGLTESYDLYQIGVYVTHPDFMGEILYIIAQCDVGNPDRIPLPSEIPVTLHYSLYLEHRGTDNVNITVDPAGMITIPVFNDLNQRVVEHVEDSGIHFSEEEIKAIKVNNAKNSDTVNGKTVQTSVPAGAVFTDTVTTVNGKTGNITLVSSDVGLGNVQNFGVATKAEAEAGVVDNKYMTPKKVKDAVSVLSPPTTWDSIPGRPSTFPPSAHAHGELMPKTGGTFTGEVNMSSQNRFMLGGKFYIRHNSAQNALEIGVLL